jgi:hypothetical protein
MKILDYTGQPNRTYWDLAEEEKVYVKFWEDLGYNTTIGSTNEYCQDVEILTKLT